MSYSIIYRISDKLPLVDYTKDSTKHGYYKKTLKSVIKSVNPVEETRVSINLQNQNEETLCCEVRNGLLVALVCSSAVPLDAVFSVIAEINKFFCLEFENRIGEFDRPFAAVSFNSRLNKIVNTLKDVFRKNKVNELGKKLSNIQNVMHENISELLKRGQKLEKMQEYAERASLESGRFARQTKWTRLKLKYQNKAIILAVVVLILSLYIYFR